jgi:hypothetical protein
VNEMENEIHYPSGDDGDGDGDSFPHVRSLVLTFLPIVCSSLDSSS